MVPSVAAAMARCSAAPKAAASVTVWSAGVITRIGSSPAAVACKAAIVRAGAVLRPAGSNSTASGTTPISRSWSRTRKRWSSLPTISGGCKAHPLQPSAPTRRTAC